MKVDRVTANHSLSSTAIQQKFQHSLSLLSLSWDVTARHKNEEKNRQAVDKFPNSLRIRHPANNRAQHKIKTPLRTQIVQKKNVSTKED